MGVDISMNGRGLYWLGRKHTEESKLKMSNAQSGKKNHFYGKKTGVT